LGQQKIKGKKKKIGVWAVKSKYSGMGDVCLLPSIGLRMAGYQQERSVIFESFDTWMASEGAEQKILFVEGKSGYGKTKLLDFVMHQISCRRIPCWLVLCYLCYKTL
jgi:hypothetical protein